jgi:signal transduction histidine kinase
MRAVEVGQTLKTLTAERWAHIGFWVAAVIIVAMGTALYESMIKSDEASRWVTHTHEVLETINGIKADVSHAESAQRGYLISGEDAQLREYEQTSAEIYEKLTHLKKLTADNPIPQRMSSQLAETISERIMILSETARVRRIDGFEAARDRLIREDLTESRRRFFESTAQMEREESRLLKEREVVEQARSRTTLLILVIAFSTGLIVLVPAYIGFAVQSRARKHALSDLMLANAVAEKASQAKDHFLATMSHELRTPMNAIIGFTGTLLMKLPGPLNTDQEKQLQTVQSSAKHLLSLINDLLDLAKIEAGKVELKLEPTDCKAVVEEVVTTLRPQAEGKGLALQVTLPDREMTISADHRALSQIILNLANNAIKFTERGGVHLKVSPGEVNGKRMVEFSVQDTGIGIRQEDQLKLFAAFAQVDGQARQSREGTGLGLHLSQKLAELLGGKITFHSEYGKGSTFTLALKER